MNEAPQHADFEYQQLDNAVAEAYRDIARYKPEDPQYTQTQLTFDQEFAYREALRRLEEGSAQPEVLALRRNHEDSPEAHEEKQQQQYVYAAELFRDILAKNEQHKQRIVRRQEIARNARFIEEIKTGVQTKRSVAQQRQQQIIDDLKRFRSATVAQARNTTSSVPPVPPAPRFAPAPPPPKVTLETLQNNGRMSVEEEARVYKEVFGDSFGHNKLSRSEAFIEDIQTKTSSIPRRIRSMFRSAKRALTDTYHNSSAASTTAVARVREYFTDDEKGRRRMIIAGVAGSVAAGAVMYIGLRHGLSSLIDNGSDNKGTNTSPVVPSVSISETEMQHTPNGVGDMIVPKNSDGSSSVKADRISKALSTSERTFSLGQGDKSTIWGQSKEYLTAHGIKGSDVNIDIVKDAVLERYDISEAEATRLPVGGRYIIPREVIEQLLKDNE